MFRPEVLRIEMHDLGYRVHASIGASSGDCLYRRGVDFGQGALEVVLQGTSIRLRLPTTKVTAIVFDA
jgi:hypothetical protein